MIDAPETYEEKGGNIIAVNSEESALEFIPFEHAPTHITEGTDIIPDAVAGGNSGLMSGADKRN